MSALSIALCMFPACVLLTAESHDHFVAKVVRGGDGGGGRATGEKPSKP